MQVIPSRWEDSTFVFHMIPSGIMHPDKICAIGNGVVVDPVALISEMDELAGRGISIDGRLFISQSAHLVMPYHMALEEAGEESQGSERIGTTRRGIGPCYQDKVERTHGVRIMDLLDADYLREKLRTVISAKNQILTRVYGGQTLNEDEIIEAYIGYGDRLQGYVTDTSVLVNEAIDAGKTVLFEGAQGDLAGYRSRYLPFCYVLKYHRGRSLHRKRGWTNPYRRGHRG